MPVKMTRELRSGKLDPSDLPIPTGVCLRWDEPNGEYEVSLSLRTDGLYSVSRCMLGGFGGGVLCETKKEAISYFWAYIEERIEKTTRRSLIDKRVAQHEDNAAQEVEANA